MYISAFNTNKTNSLKFFKDNNSFFNLKIIYDAYWSILDRYSLLEVNEDIFTLISSKILNDEM